MQTHGTLTAANDNAERPASFDAQLLQYQPLLRKIVNMRSYNIAGSSDEFIAETNLLALRRWTKYNSDYSFGTFLIMIARNVARMQKELAAAKMRSGKMVDIDDIQIADPNAEQAFEPSHVHHGDLESALPTGRDGAVLRMFAAGSTLAEIARGYGISRERARQIFNRGCATTRSNLAASGDTRKAVAA